MTEAEFRKLRCGDFVTCPGNRDDLVYRIVQEDVWGPPKLVYLARLEPVRQPGSHERVFVQISEGNFQYWQRTYPNKGEDLL